MGRRHKKHTQRPCLTAVADAGRRAPHPLQRFWRGERGDLLLFAACVALVPLVWYLLLGWSPGRLVSGNDAPPNSMLLARELADTGGDWAGLLYRPDLLGGIKLRDAVGPFPPLAWFARAGLGVADIYNLSLWLVQILLGFLAARAARDLSRSWSRSKAARSWWADVAAILLTAFAPVLGWRVGHGHLNLLTGLLPFAAGIALVAASAAGALSATLALAAVAALALGLLFTGYQLVLYGALFGGTLLLGLWWSLGRRWQALAVPALCLLLAALVAWPAFAPVWAHAQGSDAARSLARTDVAYSYLTGRWQDLLAGLLWTSAAVPAGQPDLAIHETNVPLGPVLLLLALIPWRRSWPLAIGLGIGAAGAVAFALDLRPVSTGLIALVPALGSFRVPTRALIPLAFALPIVAAAVLDDRGGRRAPRFYVLAVAGFFAALWLPSVWRELLIWVVTIAYVWPWLRQRAATWLAPMLVAGILAGAGIGAFRERLAPFPDVRAILARADALGHAVLAARPELESPLNRVSLAVAFPELGPNTGFACRLSTLDGYYYPSRRFLELFWALRGQPYEPSAVLLQFPRGAPWAGTFYQLYNVGWAVGEREPSRGQLAAWPLGPTAGPAWFSARLSRTPSFQSLAEELRRPGRPLADGAHEVMWVVDADPRLPATLPAALDPRCRVARVTRVDGERRRPWTAVDVETPADCPLTLSTNYAETLHATLDGPEGRDIPLFPAYGALTGVLVPANARRVWVAPRP